jgi:hypothetical protein
MAVKRGHSAATALAAGVLVLLVAACGGAAGPGVASVKSSSTSTTVPGGVAGNSGGPPTQAQLRAMLRFAECARKRGLPSFPDPPYQAGELNNLGFSKDSPQMEKATRECHALALASGFVESQAEIEHYIKMYLEMASCMRSRGIANFPEPNGKAQLSVTESVEDEPGYPTAAKACGAPPRAPASYWERSGAPKPAS